LCYAIINQAIDDRDLKFASSKLLLTINDAIDIDTTKLRKVKQASCKWIDNLESRLIVDGY
jgi:hypothetical protein